MNVFRRPLSAVATAPLATVELGLGLAAAPLFGRTAPWVVVIFFGACAARLLMNRRGARLPSLPAKVLFFALGVGGIAWTYGTFLGIEPGLSFLILLVSLKLLETNTVRDFQVVSLLGFFLALCDLFFTQALVLWLYVAVIFVLVTAALVRFHRGAGEGSLRDSGRTASVLLLQAVPIVILLFLFFPRSRQHFLMIFSQTQSTGGGMSDILSPGSIASLALGKDRAFSADFPDGNAPPMSAMYWRGVVLWHGDGLTWTRGTKLSAERQTGQLAGATVRQRIVVQPHGGPWLFALDRPASTPAGARLQPGGFLQSERAIFKPKLYEVISRPENREAYLPADQRMETNRKPTRISPRVQALVNGWRSEHPDNADLVDTALYYFRAQRFTYTLDPGAYGGPDPLDQFLFERRAGFCEHYAAAFASLMRIAGIPSRVVIGYHGGEYNALGKYVIVSQSDAHAWCEVWLKDEGWRRIDPTEMIAPDRLTSNLATFLETHAPPNPSAAPRSSASTGWRDIRHELGLGWDGVNFWWDLRVLGFDDESQRSFLATLGLSGFGWGEILSWVAAIILLVLCGIGLWQRRSGPRAGDPARRAYAHFCGTLAAAGLPREPWEGPHHFGERAAARFASHAGAIRQISALYTRLRYAPSAPPPAEFIHAVRSFPPLERR